MRRELNICDLGCVAYGEAQALQELLFAERVADRLPDTLLLLEHDHVLTLGRSADEANVLQPIETLARRGVSIEKTGRGGDVTYHGPGQLVAYPIIALKQAGMGVTDYVTALEEVLICVLEKYGVAAGRDKRNRGVWVGNEKIAAIGLRVRKQVSIHGFALNVSTDLSMYDAIVPCGISDAGVTSMKRQGVDAGMGEVKSVVADTFVKVLDYDEVNYVQRSDIEKA